MNIHPGDWSFPIGYPIWLLISFIITLPVIRLGNLDEIIRLVINLTPRHWCSAVVPSSFVYSSLRFYFVAGVVLVWRYLRQRRNRTNAMKRNLPNFCCGMFRVLVDAMTHYFANDILRLRYRIWFTSWLCRHLFVGYPSTLSTWFWYLWGKVF